MTSVRQIPTRCPLCGDVRSRLVTRGADRLERVEGEFSVVSCRSCGTWRLDPAPIPADLPKLYPTDYEAHNRLRERPTPVIPGRTHTWRRRFVEWAEAGRPSLWSLPLRRLPDHLLMRAFSRTQYGRFNPLAYPGDGRRILDVGCGSGDLMAQFLGHGWSPVGIEPSEHAVANAKARGLIVEQGNFPEDAGRVAEHGPFYALVMSNVLEHLPDPALALRTAADLLEPEGLLLLWVPVADGWQQRWTPRTWFNLDLPRHMSICTRRGLASLLRQTGFDILATWPGTSARAVIRTVAARYKGTPREAAVGRLEFSPWALRAVGPIIRVLDAMNQGDIEIVLARRAKETPRPS
ncbi:MAG: class I SAM-dependent methyltransferase [Deltaproteobacteria bacterium]|nr:class I SAM-dependent methyltransferase [Deltaproteobacteria bacterium]MCB9478273.1 class I SAM-dependent methyltransferase [Deltaproteobacteria bacterium]